MNIIPDRLESKLAKTLGSNKFMSYAITLPTLSLLIIGLAAFAKPETINALSPYYQGLCVFCTGVIIGAHWGDAKVRSSIAQAESTRPPQEVTIEQPTNVVVKDGSNG